MVHQVLYPRGWTPESDLLWEPPGVKDAEPNTRKEQPGGHSVPHSQLQIPQASLFVLKTRRPSLEPSDAGCNA